MKNRKFIEALKREIEHMNNYQREYLGQWVKDGTIQPTPAPQVVIDPTPAQKELAELFGDTCYDFEKTYDLLFKKAKDSDEVYLNEDLFLYVCNKIKAMPVIYSNGINWWEKTSLELCGANVFFINKNVKDYEGQFQVFNLNKEILEVVPYIKS